MDADFRAERRRFILAQHPDRGGDAHAFAEGLRGFDTHPKTGPAPERQATNGPAAYPPADVTGPAAEEEWPVSLWSLILRRMRERRR